MIALIDADFLLYLCTYQKLGSPEQTPESVINSADTFLWEIFKRVEATHYIGFLTAPNTFRKASYSDYKANRKKVELPQHFHLLKDHLKTAWKFIEELGYEADDLINIYKFKLNDDYIVVSPDKDILKLKGLNYNPTKKVMISTTPQEEFIYFWRSMLHGDRSDNILGIDGVGPVKASKLIVDDQDLITCRQIVLNEYIGIYGEYEGILNFKKNYFLLKLLEKPLDTDRGFIYITPLEIQQHDFRRIHENNP